MNTEICLHNATVINGYTTMKNCAVLIKGHKIIDVLESFAESIVELDEEQCDLAEYVESIDEDLSDIEDDIYDDEELDEDCDDLSFIEMECPNCNDLVEIDEELLYDDEVDVVCPNCKAIILSSDDDDDYNCTDCDCGE